MKPSELKRIVNKEFNIDTLKAYLEVVEDRIYFVEKAMDLGTRPQIKGFMSHMKNLKEALKQLQEEKPGLWANIRAKRARGEKPAHKNSNAHKDAVKAGKKINKMSEGEGKSLQDLQMGEKFTFNGKEYTFIELYPEVDNAARVIKPDGKKSIVSFGGGKVNTGKVAGIGPDAFGQGKGHHID